MSEGNPRGRKKIDDPIFITQVLIDNRDEIISEGQLRHPSSRIWNELKIQNNINKSAKALYTCVACNRWDLKYKLGLLKRKERDEVNDTCYNESIGSNSEDDQDENTDDIFEVGTDILKQPNTSFKIHIPKEKWKSIEPEERVYLRNISKDPTRTTPERKYMVFKSGIWTHIFNSLVWEAIKWPCSWSYKRNRISTTDEARFWIVVIASCACGNRLIITSPNPPPANPLSDGISLDVRVFGNTLSHSNFTERKIRKRPLKGENRRQLENKMVDMNIKASRIRYEMASEIIKFQDPEPAHLPTADVGRHIRSEAQRSKRMDCDPVLSLQMLKYSKNPLYMFCIKDIGLDPFFVHIYTPDQIKLYSMYCSTSYSRLIIDATGKLVQKLKKPGNTQTGHIFLYIGVIRMPEREEGIIPVTQMLSERHNANGIQFWLAEWVRAGAPIPQEIVIDDSAAIISAVCKVFGRESSTAAYLETSFKFMEGDENAKPNCLIRIDVAHLTNLICKWPEIKNLSKKTKEFFVRVIVIIAKSRFIQEANDTILSIFIVSLSETEGASESTGELTPCEIKKKIVLSKIAGINVNGNNEEFITPDNIDDNGNTNTDVHNDQELDEETTFTSIKCWVENIETHAKECIIDDGDRDNIMYQPSIVGKLKKLLYILPLWCNALSLKMGSPYPRSVGAYVETEISHLKNNLIRKNLRIDDFVRDYLEDYFDGAIKLASTNQRSQACTLINQKNNNTNMSSVSRPEDFTHQKSEQKSNINENLLKQIVSCPVCANGDFPEGAHRCLNCNKAVHALEECSTSTGDGEGYGQKRLCRECFSNKSLHSYINNNNNSTNQDKIQLPNNMVLHSNHTNKSLTTSKKITQSKITTYTSNQFQELTKLTSIVDRTDLSTMVVKDKTTGEASVVEGWKGLALPPKKRPDGYYWRANPDFPLLLPTSKSTKLGVLKNGMDPTLKLTNIGKSKISLSNTCSFDAPCQIFASAYSDSELYREALNKISIKNTILDAAKHLATKGLNSLTYKKRAIALVSTFQDTVLKGGILKLDCAMDSSALLRQLDLPPSITEKYLCSSPYCPSSCVERKVKFIPIIVDAATEDVFRHLEAYMVEGGAEETSSCFQPMADDSTIPQEYCIVNPDVSVKGPVCAGKKTRNSEEAGPHVILEVIGRSERNHSDVCEIGVQDLVASSLKTIPKTISFKNNSYNLRGVVGFMPPYRDSDIGHYRGYCVRTDFNWELYDDLREKVVIVDSSVEVNVHIIIYTL